MNQHFVKKMLCINTRVKAININYIIFYVELYKK